MTKNILINLSEEEVEFINWLAKRDGLTEQSEMRALFSLQLHEEMELHGEEFIRERRDKAMKWRKEYFGDASNPRIAYVSGEYRIVRSQSTNIWTGRVMSEQVWHIFKNGEKVDYAFTLKEAKAIVERSAR